MSRLICMYLEILLTWVLGYVLLIKHVNLSLVEVSQKDVILKQNSDWNCRIAARAGVMAARAGANGRTWGGCGRTCGRRTNLGFWFCQKGTCGPLVWDQPPHVRGAQPHVRHMWENTGFSVLRAEPSDIFRICILCLLTCVKFIRSELNQERI